VNKTDRNLPSCDFCWGKGTSMNHHQHADDAVCWEEISILGELTARAEEESGE